MGSDPVDVEIVHLLASPVHRYAGRPRDGALGVVPGSPTESHARVRVVAGRGVLGDRYYGQPAHRRAAVTLLDADALDAVAAQLGLPPFDPAPARRNVVLRGALAGGIVLDELRGRVLTLDCGQGPVRLRGGRPARPCAWMDTQLADGAHAAMRGHGGVRCEPLTSGWLRLGPATLVVDAPDGQGPPPRC